MVEIDLMLTKNDLKLIKSLRLKKYRTREQLYVIEGKKSIEEALRCNLDIRRLMGTEELKQLLDKQGLLQRRSFEVTNQKTLESVSNFQSSNMGLALLSIREPVTPPQTGVQIVLDGVRDPGNLGTIIRSMDWFGYKTLICSPDCADFYNPKTLAATMGSFTRIQPYYSDPAEYMKRCPNLPVYGMLLGGDPMESTAFPEDGLFILGSESHGIGSNLLPYIQNRIAITRFGEAESLNVAMATSILLFALRNGK